MMWLKNGVKCDLLKKRRSVSPCVKGHQQLIVRTWVRTRTMGLWLIPVEIKCNQERFVCMGLCSPTEQSWTACLRKCDNDVSLKRCVGISLSPALSFSILCKTVNLHAMLYPRKCLSTRSFILRKKNDYRPKEDPETVPPIHSMQTDKWLIPRNRQ